MTTPSTPPKAGDRAGKRFALVASGVVLASFAASRLYAKSAAPVERTVALVEQNPNVAAFLGSPVTVSLAFPRKLWRNPLKAAMGEDTVTLVTTARGPRGEARLSMTASDTKARGWFGSFSVVIEGEAIPQISGCYMIEGAQLVLKGLIGRDGAPVINAARKP